MDLKTLKELLASLNINPDDIEDEIYATAFRILFATIYLKVNKPNPKFVVLKRVKIFLLKMRDEKEGFYRTRNLNQNWIK